MKSEAQCIIGRSTSSMNPKGVEARYGIPVGSLANMRCRKVGPSYIKVGHKILYRPQDIENWLNGNVVLTRDSI